MKKTQITWNIDVNPATFFYSEAVHQKILSDKANHQLNVGDFNQMVLNINTNVIN